jgi:hypothetical protein
LEIERHYICPIGNCGKNYGSEGSLNQHIKLKHKESHQAYKKQQQALLLLENAKLDKRFEEMPIRQHSSSNEVEIMV